MAMPGADEGVIYSAKIINPKQITTIKSYYNYNIEV